jgi:hypothetical protein
VSVCCRLPAWDSCCPLACECFWALHARLFRVVRCLARRGHQGGHRYDDEARNGCAHGSTRALVEGLLPLRCISRSARCMSVPWAPVPSSIVRLPLLLPAGCWIALTACIVCCVVSLQGPLTLADFIGLDTCLSIMQARHGRRLSAVRLPSCALVSCTVLLAAPPAGVGPLCELAECASASSPAHLHLFCPATYCRCCTKASATASTAPLRCCSSTSTRACSDASQSEGRSVFCSSFPAPFLCSHAHTTLTASSSALFSLCWCRRGFYDYRDQPAAAGKKS